MALWRWRRSKEFDFPPNKPERVVPADSEIDMHRPAPRPSLIVRTVSRMLRWMMPPGNSMGPPMRSVAREAEEVFPSDDR